MRMNRLWLAVILGVVLVRPAVASDGSGVIRSGYEILDEEGNLAVNQESFNLYEGPALSLEDFHYLTDAGLNFSADLKNLTLNNRQLRGAVGKSGLFGLSVLNNQYRRIYSNGGDKFARRRLTTVEAHAYPLQSFKLFGGFTRRDRNGELMSIYAPTDDTILTTTSYNQSQYHFGGEYASRRGQLRLEYQRANYSDDQQASNDRNADVFEGRFFAPVPRYERLAVGGGFRHRRDQLDNADVALTTNQGWVALRADLPYDLSGDYRFLAARTKRGDSGHETDNFINTINLGRTWAHRGGLRVGYENRISDDLIDRAIAHVFMAAGWWRWNDRWMARTRLSTRLKEIKTGTTLLGDEDFTRYQVAVTYTEKDWGDVTVRYQGRVKTNNDIHTRVEYSAFTTDLRLDRAAYGKLQLTYSYYLGRFENRSGASLDEYEFADHAITGTLRPRAFYRFETQTGVTYYRSRRDRDTEKIGLTLGAGYPVASGWRVEAVYRALNFDNFLANDQYYTGNIVSLYLIKAFAL